LEIPRIPKKGICGLECNACDFRAHACWLVAGGWWLVAGGWRLLAGLPPIASLVHAHGRGEHLYWGTSLRHQGFDGVGRDEPENEKVRKKSGGSVLGILDLAHQQVGFSFLVAIKTQKLHR